MAAAQHVEAWEAAQERQAQEAKDVKEVKIECDNGVPRVMTTKATQLSILVSRAQADSVSGLPETRIAAVDALGALGDARAAPVPDQRDRERDSGAQ